MKKQIRLQTKLILSVGVTLLILVGIISGMLMYRESQFYSDITFRKIYLSTTSTSRRIGQLLYNSNWANLAVNLMNDYMNDKEMIYFFVTDPDGYILISNNDQVLDTLNPLVISSALRDEDIVDRRQIELHPYNVVETFVIRKIPLKKTVSHKGEVRGIKGDMVFDTIREIKNSGKLLGYLRMGFSSKLYYQQQKQMIFYISVMGFIIFISIIGIIIWVIRRNNQPLISLTKSLNMLTLSGGKEPLRTQVEKLRLDDIKTSNLEVSNLKTAFKNMQSLLIDKWHELESANSSLESAISHQQRLAARAESANKAKSRFLANMSHEIRTPMYGVIGMADLLRETELDIEQKKYAEGIRNSAESLLSVINDILDFSKIEAGQLDVVVVDFNLLDIVESVIDILSLQAQNKNIELTGYIHPDVPVRLRGDENRIRQVLINLMGNGIKFTEKGRVSVAVYLAAKHSGQVVIRFDIIDTGIGIPIDKQDQLFKSFSQIDDSITRNYHGSGLGLAISKQITELMGGNIGVESQDGQGSRFWFTVRLDMPESLPAGDPDPAFLDEKILMVVDENPLNRALISDAVSSWGGTVVPAEDGVAALAVLDRLELGQRPELIIIDTDVIQQDDNRLVTQLSERSDFTDVPVILMSSSIECMGPVEKDDSPFDACLPKPVKRNILKTVLSGIFNPLEDSFVDLESISQKSDISGCVELPYVLVAEDHPVNRKIVINVLQKLGCLAEAVTNGSEAVSRLNEKKFDLVLMDIQMPVMDGIAAAKAIRASAGNNQNVPIIAITAHAMKGDREICLEAGMNDYISKPIRIHDLSKLLSHYFPVVSG